MTKSAFISCTILFFCTFALPGAAPELEHFHPPGVGVGTTNLIRITGKFEPWPPKLWCDTDGLEFVARTNKGEFDVVAKRDVQPGVCLVRVFNEEGASEPRPFVIGAGEEPVDAEPNDRFDQPQILDRLPVVVSGRLDKSGDVDSFAVDLKSGQTLEASVDSFLLMSRLDAVLRVVTTNGLQLAWNHDFATIDPRLTWQATNDQTVVVQVFGFPYPANADIRLTGGDGAIYRLHLRAGDHPEGFHKHASCEGLLATNFVFNRPGQALSMNLESSTPGWLAAEVRAESIGSPVDPWLAIENADGKQIQRNDDADGSRDPKIEWLASGDTNYIVKVGSLTRGAGDDQRVELLVRRVEPGFEAEAAASSLVVKPDSTNEFKVTVRRLRGFTNRLQIVAADLPDGITSEPVEVGEKGGDVQLKLVASAEAKAFQGPLRVVAKDLTADKAQAVPFLLTGTAVNNGVPGGYRVLLADRTDTLWLTVRPKEEAKPGSEEKK